ncbi:hypothetical protein [Streptosporangium roseum]|uniref:hypothetical protein n=1 Tax=Streptosporangium roseum TaxID=2001 RepID=UPI0004CD2B75|nr:hypothetical protein [Streptosporangium roseum]
MPNSRRQASITAETGCQSAITRNAMGRPSLDTNEFEMNVNVSGSRNMSIALDSSSGDFAVSPIAAAIQDAA